MSRKKPRNYVALAAYSKTGSGTHADKRTKRLRTRSSQRRAALREQGSD